MLLWQNLKPSAIVLALKALAEPQGQAAASKAGRHDAATSKTKTPTAPGGKAKPAA